MAPKDLLLFILPLNEVISTEPEISMCKCILAYSPADTLKGARSTVKLEVMCLRDWPPLLWVPVAEPLAWDTDGVFETELEHDQDQNETSSHVLKQSMTS